MTILILVMAGMATAILARLLVVLPLVHPLAADPLETIFLRAVPGIQRNPAVSIGDIKNGLRWGCWSGSQIRYVYVYYFLCAHACPMNYLVRYSISNHFLIE